MICALTLKICKWGNNVTVKRCFKQYYKKNVFLDKYGKYVSDQ